MIPDHLIEQRKQLTKLSKQEQNQRYYEKQKRNKRVCECCCCEVLPSYWKTHIKTSRHKKYEEYKNKILTQ